MGITHFLASTILIANGISVLLQAEGACPSHVSIECSPSEGVCSSSFRYCIGGRAHPFFTLPSQLTCVNNRIIPVSRATCNSKPTIFYVGTYTEGYPWLPGTPGPGVLAFSLSPTGSVVEVQRFSKSVSGPNPAYAAFAQNRKMLYVVNEVEPGTVQAFRMDTESGALVPVGQLTATGGAAPVHIAVSEDENFLFFAHWAATLTVLAINSDGSIGNIVASRTFDPSSNLHQTKLRGNAVYIPDISRHVVRQLIWNPWMRTLSDNPAGASFASLPNGGPRHMVFHPTKPFAYLVDELTVVIEVLVVENSGILRRVTSYALTNTPSGHTAAAVHVDKSGTFVYASIRGPQSAITAFKINQSSGDLTWVGTYPTGGLSPRDFAVVDTSYVLVGNAASGSLTVMKIDPVTGALQMTSASVQGLGSPAVVLAIA